MLYDFLKKYFFPQNYTCDICGEETFCDNLCRDCRENLALNDKITCPVCGRATTAPQICDECKAYAPLFTCAASAFVYENSAVTLIHKFKNGSAYLKEYFADALKEKAELFPDTDYIICVPMTDKSLKKRGYDQVKLLAEALAKRTGYNVLDGAVEKVKATAEQKELDRRQREENIKGCFKVTARKEIKGKNVMILDDVLTTGATANEMSRILKAAGAKHVYVLTVASVPDKRSA